MLVLYNAHHTVHHVDSTEFLANSHTLWYAITAVTFKSHQISSACHFSFQPIIAAQHMINLDHYWNSEDILNIEIQGESMEQRSGGF